MSIKVLVVDDQQTARKMICALLETYPDVELAAEAENGRDAVRLARETDADVVLMDIGLPDISGVVATKEIVSENPEAKVLALSMHTDGWYVGGFLSAGGKGYLCKEDVFTELNAALHAVHANETYLSKTVRRT